jgi:cysteinyl-tRNA synthetase
VEQLITLRGQLRDDGSYQTADAIRDALAAAGLQLRDGTDGTGWELEPHPS